VHGTSSVNPFAGFFFLLASRWLGQLSEYVQKGREVAIHNRDGLLLGIVHGSRA
jgi:hypothetical protein